MVLWEITLATAYFLGLKKTYRLALKLQRRLISPKHPKIRGFIQRRTRIAFKFAVSVHKKIQEKDLEVGRNFGNWILQFIGRAKPSAQVRPSLPLRRSVLNAEPKRTAYGRVPGANYLKNKAINSYLGSRLLAIPWRIRPKTFPTIAMSMMVLPPRSTGIFNQYRQYLTYKTPAPEFLFGRESGSVFRKDIVQWMQLS